MKMENEISAAERPSARGIVARSGVLAGGLSSAEAEKYCAKEWPGDKARQQNCIIDAMAGSGGGGAMEKLYTQAIAGGKEEKGG